jgi:predicted nucleic acid-binding protein
VVALLDSGVVAGFLDRDDAFHAAADHRIRQLAGRDQLVASVITYAELLTGARLGHHSQGAGRGFFANLVDQVHVVDGAVAERAAEIRTFKRSLRLPDALVLATVAVHDADVVVTTDRRWAGVLPGRRIEIMRPAS